MARLAGAGMVAAALTVALTGCISLTACPAIGHLYTGPAILRFAPPVPASATVSACFGDGCLPAQVPRVDDSRWEVPQASPHLGEGVMGDGSVQQIRVVVAMDDGTVVSDAEHRIPVTVERTGIYGQCPGPFTFDEVPITLPG